MGYVNLVFDAFERGKPNKAMEDVVIVYEKSPLCKYSNY
jgi:hypothetical protein